MKKKDDPGWDTPWNRKVMRGLFNKYWDGYKEYCTDLRNKETGVFNEDPVNFLRYIIDKEKELYEQEEGSLIGQLENQRK